MDIIFKYCVYLQLFFDRNPLQMLAGAWQGTHDMT